MLEVGRGGFCSNKYLAQICYVSVNINFCRMLSSSFSSFLVTEIVLWRLLSEISLPSSGDSFSMFQIFHSSMTLSWLKHSIF